MIYIQHEKEHEVRLPSGSVQLHDGKWELCDACAPYIRLTMLEKGVAILRELRAPMIITEVDNKKSFADHDDLVDEIEREAKLRAALEQQERTLTETSKALTHWIEKHGKLEALLLQVQALVQKA